MLPMHALLTFENSKHAAQYLVSSSHNVYSIIGMYRDTQEDLCGKRKGNNFALASKQDFGYSVLCVPAKSLYVSALTTQCINFT